MNGWWNCLVAHPAEKVLVVEWHEACVQAKPMEKVEKVKTWEETSAESTIEALTEAAATAQAAVTETAVAEATEAAAEGTEALAAEAT